MNKLEIKIDVFAKLAFVIISGFLLFILIYCKILQEFYSSKYRMSDIISTFDVEMIDDTALKTKTKIAK